jgi:lysozyme
MQLSPAGEALIKSFEKLDLTAYQDQGGVWTIGWGHTPATDGQICTVDQAESWFLADTAGACRAVNTFVDVAMAQGQFDALVSFVFNVGAGNFHGSTLLRLLNGGDMAGAADQFLVWNKIGGAISDGLSRRRTAERAMFLGLV